MDYGPLAPDRQSGAARGLAASADSCHPMVHWHQPTHKSRAHAREEPIAPRISGMRRCESKRPPQWIKCLPRLMSRRCCKAGYLAASRPRPVASDLRQEILCEIEMLVAPGHHALPPPGRDESQSRNTAMECEFAVKITDALPRDDRFEVRGAAVPRPATATWRDRQRRIVALRMTPSRIDTARSRSNVTPSLISTPPVSLSLSLTTVSAQPSRACDQRSPRSEAPYRIPQR
jgi:hypothetical protein